MNVRTLALTLGAAAVMAAPAGAQSLTGAGATFPNPIYTKWFDAYNKATGVQINYQSIGSGGGIRQFTEGTVDFGATDGPMSDEQMDAVQKQRAARPDRARRGGADLQPARRSAPPSSSSTAPRSPTSSSAASPSGTTSGSPRSNPGVDAAQRRHHRGAPVRRVGHHATSSPTT